MKLLKNVVSFQAEVHRAEGGRARAEAGAAAAARVGGALPRQPGDRPLIPAQDPLPQVQQGDHQAHPRPARSPAKDVPGRGITELTVTLLTDNFVFSYCSSPISC